MNIRSEYPWQKGPEWGQAQGLVAVLEADGHRFEIHKRPYVRPAHHIKAHGGTRGATNTSRYSLKVDGTPRGSESPKLYSVVAEADAMVSWGRALGARQ